MLDKLHPYISALGKLRPYIAAIGCAFLGVMTIAGDVTVARISGSLDPVCGMSFVYYCYLPLCLYFLGAYMSEMRQEIRELRARLEGLTLRGDGDIPDR
jgi:hypothetical protein